LSGSGVEHHSHPIHDEESSGELHAVWERFSRTRTNHSAPAVSQKVVLRSNACASVVGLGPRPQKPTAPSHHHGRRRPSGVRHRSGTSAACAGLHRHLTRSSRSRPADHLKPAARAIHRLGNEAGRHGARHPPLAAPVCRSGLHSQSW
jgi:hypothetical protein